MPRKSKNAALLVGSGVISGALLTSIVFLGIPYLDLETRDFTQMEVVSPRETSNQEQDTTSTTSSLEYRGSPRSELSDSLAETLKLDNDFDQTVALYNLLAGADEERVLNLIDQARTLVHSHRRDAVLSIIFSKYAAIDPVSALSRTQEYSSGTRDQLIDRIFHQWAQKDLVAALASAQSLSEEQRETASRSILDARDDLGLERLYELADELKNWEYRRKFAVRLWKTRAQEDPRSAWQNATQLTGDTKDKPLALTTVAEAWVEEEGLSVLDEISNSTIREFYKARIYRTVLRQIAETDIEKAVAAAASLGLNPSEFGSTSRVVSGLFEQWAEEEPYQLFGLADSLDQRFVSIAKHQALTAIARKSPQEAVALLAQVDNPAFVRRASATIAAQWAMTDPKSSLEWYLSSERSEQDRSLRFIIERMVEDDAHGAFKIVTNYPGEIGTHLTNSFFENIVYRDGFDATEFISLLDDDARQIPVTMLGQKIVKGDIHRALELEKHLPESERKEYRDKIISAALYPDPFYLLENIDQLPGRDLQAQAALQLLIRDKNTGLFSEKQAKNLRSRLNADGHQKLDSVVVTGRYYW